MIKKDKTVVPGCWHVYADEKKKVKKLAKIKKVSESEIIRQMINATMVVAIIFLSFGIKVSHASQGGCYYCGVAMPRSGANYDYRTTRHDTSTFVTEYKAPAPKPQVVQSITEPVKATQEKIVYKTKYVYIHEKPVAKVIPLVVAPVTPKPTHKNMFQRFLALF